MCIKKAQFRHDQAGWWLVGKWLRYVDRKKPFGHSHEGQTFAHLTRILRTTSATLLLLHTTKIVPASIPPELQPQLHRLAKPATSLTLLHRLSSMIRATFKFKNRQIESDRIFQSALNFTPNQIGWWFENKKRE
jgi:hypothetical protein